MRFRLAFVVTALFISVGTVVSTAVMAQEARLSDAHIARIKAECAGAFVSIDQLHRSDARLRVNRGQYYEYISTKLMAPLNSRIAFNRLDGTALIAATTQYEKALSQFRSDYITYEQAVARVLKVNCYDEPQRFYELVMDARQKRGVVHEDVVLIHQYIDEYQAAFRTFRADYELSVKGDGV